MSEIDIEFHGLKEFEADLNQLEEASRKALAAFVADLADEWQIQAFVTGSVDTGAYQRGISAKQFVGGGASARDFVLVESDKHYSHYLEFGSEKMEARHVAARAIEELDRIGQIFDRFDEFFNKALKGSK